MVSGIENIIWSKKNKPITSYGIKTVNNFLYKLPNAFINLLKISNGGEINYVFNYYDIEDKCNINTGTPCIFGIKNKDDDLIKYYKNLQNFFPKNLVPFSETGNGDRICFDYRYDTSSTNPPVVYWNHEASENNDVSLIASNFDEFIKILSEPKDEKNYTEKEIQELIDSIPK